MISLRDPISSKIIKKGDCINILGLRSEYNGEMTFNGSYLIFEIAFRPTGLNEIFGIPDSGIKNHIIDGRALFGLDIHTFYERLCDTKDIKEMGRLADAYLMHYLLKKNQVCRNKNLLKIVGNIVNSNGKKI